MRAHIPVNRKTRDELEAIGQRAVERERQDIATRCLYIVLLACWQIGLAPRTMRRIKGAIPVVTEKFASYRTEQLADLWAKTLLDDAGVDVPETTEPL